MFFEQYKICRSSYFEALRMQMSRSGQTIEHAELLLDLITLETVAELILKPDRRFRKFRASKSGKELKRNLPPA